VPSRAGSLPAPAGAPTTAAHGRALVVVATYNESENLPNLLARVWRSADVDVLIVDDNSPDGTGQLADAMARVDHRLTVLHRPAKAGLAGAQLSGFAHAIRCGYDVVIQMDADLSHPPEVLPRMLRASRHADVVIGSRRVPGGDIVGRSHWRNLLTRAAGTYTRSVLRLPVRDCTAGFRCIRVSALARMDSDRVTCQGYGFIIETNFALSRMGARFVEVPIVFPDRVAGTSKLSMSIMFEALAVVARLRMRLTAPALLAGGPAIQPRETTQAA